MPKDPSQEITARDGRIILIREAEGEDAGPVLAYVDQICQETNYLTFGPGEFDYSLEEEIDYLEACRAAEHCLFLLALHEGKIVGVLTFSAGVRPRLRHAGEFGISVLRAYWGIGVASALIDALVGWARGGGTVRKINLRVRADNRRAISLYERKGFKVEGRLRKEILLEGRYYDNLWMGIEV